jgi:hypothetical protein
MNMKILSCGEQIVSCDERENASDRSIRQHGIWAKSGAEQPHFPFTGKPGTNADLEVVFYTRNCRSNNKRNLPVCQKKLLDNIPNPKLTRSRAHH